MTSHFEKNYNNSRIESSRFDIENIWKKFTIKFNCLSILSIIFGQIKFNVKYAAIAVSLE